MNDETSTISQLLKEHKEEIRVLKPGMNTNPHVFYIGLPDEFVDGVDGQASVRLTNQF
jgi:tetrathionate reductase subunit B